MAAAGIGGIVVKVVTPMDARAGIAYIIRACEEAVDEIRGTAPGLIDAGLGFSAPEAIEASVQRAVVKVADRLGVPLHVHLAESLSRAAAFLKATGYTHLQWFRHQGALGPRFHAVHGVALRRDELASLAAAGASLIHCPVSNLYLGSGIACINEAVRCGLNVALGTDGSATNNSQDLLLTMRVAAIGQTMAPRSPAPLSPHQVFAMAVVGGARALGMTAASAAVREGARADLTILRWHAPHLVPAPDPLSNVVHAAHAGDLMGTVVNGRLIMAGGRWLLGDGKAIVSQIAGRATVLHAGLARHDRSLKEVEQ